jgi:ubiquinone/menaquinone biosynthesis C-methylase UbiE
MAFESLYDNFIAEYYDASPIVRNRGDLDFYVDSAKEFGDPVLELGCGSGRVTLAVAQAGLAITGLDLSRKMLAQAEEKLDKLPAETRSRVNLLQGNMTNFDLGERFRLAIIPFRPFQHLLDVQQQLDCLKCVHRHLEPAGRLALDFFQTDARRMHDPEFLKERQAAEYEMSGGRKVRLTERVTAFHRAEQRNDVEMVYHVTHADGRQEQLTMAFPFRYFFRYEVEHLLARGGFHVEETFGDFDRSPLRDNSPEMIFLVRAL